MNQPTHINNEKAVYVWERLSNIYGIRFVQENGVTPNYDWVKKMDSFSVEQINQGIENLINANTRYMINLSHFVDLIKIGNGDTEEQRLQAARSRECEQRLRLPQQKTKTIQAKVGMTKAGELTPQMLEEFWKSRYAVGA